MLSRSCARLLPAFSRNGANALRRPHPLSAAAGHQRPSPCRPDDSDDHRRSWSADAGPKQAAKRKKKKSNVLSEGPSSGRVAWYEERAGKAKKASAHPKLCAGCGVEMVSGRGPDAGRKMAAGEEANRIDRSKKAQKRARWADAMDEKGGGGGDLLCGRCVALQDGDVWKAYDALKDVDAKVFSSQLAHVVGRRKFSLCVVVVDATDPEFTAVKKLRDWIKATPCILAINKADLLPRPMNRYDLNYMKHRVENQRLRNVMGAYGVSAIDGTGMVDLAEAILENLGGRDVFVVGSANVGKSTLVKSLSALLARTLRLRGRTKKADDKRRDALKNLKITQSHLPGTTLQAVRIPCFPSSRHAMWDTPGIINKSAVAYSLFPSHYMEPLAFPERIEIPTFENGKKVRLVRGQSILIEAGWVSDVLGEEEGEKGKEGDDAKDALSNMKKEEEWRDDHGDSVSDEFSNAQDVQRKYGGAGVEEHCGEASGIDKDPNQADDDECEDDASTSFTLARLDILEDNKVPIEALAFVPSCLTVRVVPTDAAPTVSAVPKEYIAKVQKLVGASGNFREEEASRPLSIFKGDGLGVNRDGSMEFTVKDHSSGKGAWIRQDVVFASLGWIMLNHGGNFKVRPWCVEGSLWSRRRAMYPSNLESLEGSEWVEEDCTAGFASMDEGDPVLRNIGARLEAASGRGRHLADTKGRRNKRDEWQSRRDEAEDDVWW